jgi:hypothetical protein
LNTAQRALHRQEQRDKQGGLSAHHAKVAVAVYILGGYNRDLANVFVRLKSKCALTQDEDLGQMVRDMFLAMLLESVVRIEVPETALDVTIRNAALKFIAEHITSKFIEYANEKKGVAPSSHDAAAEYMRQCDILGMQTSSSSLRKALDNSYVDPRTSKRRVRKWSQEFRGSWGLGFGALRSRNPLPQEDIMEKAGSFLLLDGDDFCNRNENKCEKIRNG